MPATRRHMRRSRRAASDDQLKAAGLAATAGPGRPGRLTRRSAREEPLVSRLPGDVLRGDVLPYLTLDDVYLLCSAAPALCRDGRIMSRLLGLAGAAVPRDMLRGATRLVGPSGGLALGGLPPAWVRRLARTPAELSAAERDDLAIVADAPVLQALRVLRSPRGLSRLVDKVLLEGRRSQSFAPRDTELLKGLLGELMRHDDWVETLAENSPVAAALTDTSNPHMLSANAHRFWRPIPPARSFTGAQGASRRSQLLDLCDSGRALPSTSIARLPSGRVLRGAGGHVIELLRRVALVPGPGAADSSGEIEWDKPQPERAGRIRRHLRAEWRPTRPGEASWLDRAVHGLQNQALGAELPAPGRRSRPSRPRPGAAPSRAGGRT